MFRTRARTGAGTGTLLRAGRFDVGPTWRLPLRITEFHALFVGLSGQFRFTVGERVETLTSGGVLWIPRHLAHHGVLGSTEASCHVVHFELHPRDQPPPNRLRHWASVDPERVDQLCLRAAADLAEQTLTGAHAGDARLNDLLALLAGAPDAASAPPAGEGTTPASVEAVAAVLNHIAHHVDSPLRITDLAAMAGLHRSHFTAVFTRLTGLPPSRYVVAARLARARELLETTSLGLDQIATRCGFDSASHLARRFNEYEGLSPGRYRTRHATTQHELGLGQQR